MDLISHLEITLIMFGRSAIQPVCLFDVYLPVRFHLIAFKTCFSDLKYEAVKSSGLVVKLKLKCLLMKPTQDDIIEAKDVYSQVSFE